MALCREILRLSECAETGIHIRLAVGPLEVENALLLGQRFISGGGRCFRGTPS